MELKLYVRGRRSHVRYPSLYVPAALQLLSQRIDDNRLVHVKGARGAAAPSTSPRRRLSSGHVRNTDVAHSASAEAAQNLEGFLTMCEDYDLMSVRPLFFR